MSVTHNLSLNQKGIIPEKAIKLAVNDYCRESFGAKLNVHPDKLPLQYGMAAGATAGFCQVIATNPMEIVKIQLQLAGSTGQKLSARHVVETLGLKGMYKGTLATLARDVPFSILFFSMVSALKNMASPSDGSPVPLSATFGSGIVAGAVAAAAVTPMDVVKTRLQVIPKPGDRIYLGQIDCYRLYFTVYTIDLFCKTKGLLLCLEV